MDTTTPLGWSPEHKRLKLFELIRSVAYRAGDFTLSSGQKSAYYIDSKKVTLHPLGAILAGALLYELLPAQTESVGGLTLGADPLVTAIAMFSTLKRYPERGVAAFIVRKEPKKHGSQQWIEGPDLSAGASVVIVDDVVTTGASGLKAAEIAGGLGCKVLKIIALVDRDQGGPELYRERGYAYEAVYSISEFLSEPATR
ncbi:MAG: orotate phosphoribosyltransferase [Gemmatimonadaceae bacterium]|nr:orotate phosphoribosyltransferase [Gloeobacterales cyanobacterium ES-bin-141]